MSDLIEYMKDPKNYPDKPESIALVQTHISWVFIGDMYVYKLKKPVDFGFLDFTTLEKRKFFVEEELRLNSRFSPDLYLDVVPISKKGEKFILNDSSNVFEYALKMKKINEDNLLNNLLASGKVSDQIMGRVGRHIAEVYGKIPSDEKSRSYGSLDTIAKNVMENFEQTEKYIGGPKSKQDHKIMQTWSADFMKNNKGLFQKRIDEGHIKDCHGDLHLQHICVDDKKIFIFDCIEFNERFRFGDVASDVAFLAMDLDYNGYPDFGQNFVNAYIETSGDTGLAEVLKFYKVYRAYVRAKVTSFMLDDKGLSESVKEDAFKKAKSYYDLAFSYIKEK
jgi:aminoglycoside phosphotransferase family enzyme